MSHETELTVCGRYTVNAVYLIRVVFYQLLSAALYSVFQKMSSLVHSVTYAQRKKDRLGDGWIQTEKIHARHMFRVFCILGVLMFLGGPVLGQTISSGDSTFLKSSDISGTGITSISEDYGQVWSEYDITPYTSRITTLDHPEYAVLDWILLDTGFQAWHGEVPAVLNVGKQRVRVYHTPEMTARVKEIIARFLKVDPQQHLFRVEVVTVGTPNWRMRIPAGVQPIPSLCSGSQAWVVSPEDLRSLVQVLESVSGYTRHTVNSANAVVNGQSLLLQLGRERTYMRDVYTRPGRGVGPEPDNVSFSDGFAVEIMPLLTLDSSKADVQVKFQCEHLERFIPLQIRPHGAVGKVPSVKIEVPQIAQTRFRERYVWKVDKTLVVSLGLTPLLTPSAATSTLPQIVNPSQRVETLIFIEYRKR